MGKFEIKQSGENCSFRLKAGNGEVIGVSESYKSMDSCKSGIASVQKNAPIAPVEDMPAGGSEKCPKFELYQDKAGEFRFRLKASNGEIILSSEGYTSKDGCKNGIVSVKKNAPDATVITAE